MRTAIITLLLFLPVAASAEVSDKMPPMMNLIGIGVTVGALFFCLAFLRWWLSLICAPVAALFVAGSIALWLEEPMRNGLIHEQGWLYFGAHAVQDILVWSAVLAGAWFGYKRRASNRIAGRFSTPASTTPRMRVRTGRFLRD